MTRLRLPLLSLVLALALVLATTARADDVVVLKDGRELRGAVREADGQVIVTRALGEVALPRDEVARIVRDPKVTPAPAPAPSLETNAATPAAAAPAEAPPADVTTHLARARDHERAGRRDAALAEYRAVVRLVPDHEPARVALGHVFMDGEWLTQEQAMARLGVVEHDGRWVSPDERDRQLAAAADARRQAREAERTAREQRREQERADEEAHRAFLEWRPKTANAPRAPACGVG